MRKKKGKDILVLAILTLITVFTWIVGDVYQALTRTTTPEILEEQMRPLQPRIDRVKIEEIKKRLTISEEELQNISVPSIEEEISIETLESTESATPSGEV
jgi:hypothetical protein